ncbi:MAG: RNA-binding protein [Tindallia sp. MSAO_Bac2]|nr:MAG: RNA-binding protein [Tindallia sp. MSAO_Bac2]
MKQQQLRVGQMVKSQQGRDQGRHFIIIDVLDDQYALLVDGNLRRLDKPKKKKIKHFKATNQISEEIKNRIESDGKLNNALVRKEIEKLTGNEKE